MGLYVVISPDCPYWEKGTFVEDGDDGCMQAVEVVMEEGRMVPMGYMGLCVPEGPVRPYLMKVQRRGLDKSW